MAPGGPGAGRSRSWRGWLVALAALVVLGVVALALALRPAPPPTPSGQPGEDRGFAWREVARPPLSPRHGAVATWYDGSFFLVGGWSAPPCRPGTTCEPGPPDLRDGARYDPATGTWSRIADAPAGFGQGVTVVAAGWNLWLADASGAGQVWEYSGYHDTWQQVPAPPRPGRLASSHFDAVALTAQGEPAGYEHALGPATGWTALRPGPLDLCGERRGFPSGDYRLLVLAECPHDGDRQLRASVYDSQTGDWTDAVPVGAAPDGRPAYSGSRLAWPDHPAAGVFDLGARAWQQVPPLAAPGPLGEQDGPPLVIGDPLQSNRPGLLVANGRLLDLGTGRWVEVPAPTVADRLAPARSAGPDGLLDCFGYLVGAAGGEGGYHDGCALLVPPTEPAPAPPGEPLVAPVQDDWSRVADPDEVGGEPVRVSSRPALTTAGGRSYLVGGSYHRGGVELPLPVRRLDPATGAWVELSAAPVEAARPVGVIGSAGDLVYTVIGDLESGQVWSYDTAADAWQWVANQDAPEERHLVTDDGLVRLTAQDDRWLVTAPPRLLGPDGWVELPRPPVLSYRLHEPFRLDDHHLALESGGRVFVLDTATRTWDEGSDPRPVAGRDRTAADGTAVFVTPLMTEDVIDPAYTARLDVLAYRGGQWSHPAPLRETGGLGRAAPAAGGRWVLVNGNVLDPATGQWLRVPPLPRLADAEPPVKVAVADVGVLACAEVWDDTGGRQLCHHLGLP